MKVKVFKLIEIISSTTSLKKSVLKHLNTSLLLSIWLQAYIR